jgi:DNA-binding HxlR family transcriptional regulator
VKVEYRLTDKGQALVPVVEALSAWAEHWMPESADEPTSV